jgi:hypothetical protein
MSLSPQVGSSPALPMARTQYPLFVRLWFLLDFVFCCFPPIYLSFSGKGTDILPLSVLYFLLCGLLTTASILVAFWFHEAPRHDSLALKV